MPGADETAALRLTALLDATDDAIVTTDLGGIVTSWNRSAETLYGFTADEAVGQHIRLLFPKGREGEEEQILDTVKNGGRLSDVDAVRMNRSGVNVPVSLTVVPLTNETGVVGTLRISRDMSGRARAERAARRLAAIVESSDDAIVSKDLNGIITSWNAAAERLFGYTAAEIIGESIRKLIPADRQSEEDAVLSAIRRGDKVDHFETIRMRKDGSFVPVSLTVSPIRDAAGHVIGASKIARDVTDRRRAEAEHARLLALAEQNAWVTQKLNEVGEVVASDLDRDRVVQAVTDAATALTTAEFGAFFYNVVDDSGESYTLYTISGAPREAFENFPMPRNTKVFDPTFRGEGIVRSADITIDPRYGQNPPYFGMPPGHLPVRSYLAVPVVSRSGGVIGGLFFGHPSVGVFTEYHERLAEGVAAWAGVGLENARLYAEVQQVNRLKDEFLATLSHELRTPLNAILGYARMVRDGIVAKERQPDAIATIERNATSLTQIVEDVLDVSRIISGKLRLSVQPLDLTTVIRNAIEAVMPAADAKGVQVTTRFDRDLPQISGDPERLQQVAWNLLSNAVKFTPRGGRVEVRVEHVEDHVEATVSDTGIGIPPAFLPHIFERFRQADSTTTRERGGLGLGLGIARQLVEMHGGTIDAGSEGVGRGATFAFRLPVLQARPKADLSPRRRVGGAHASALAAMPDLRGIRVLAVDDDPDALAMVREILEAGGARVETAESAPRALELIERARPDVLVADLAMPRMDGFALIRQVRASHTAAVRTVPAAALTAYARSEDRDRALKQGFQCHLSKPIDPGELMLAVAKLAHPAAQTR